LAELRNDKYTNTQNKVKKMALTALLRIGNVCLVMKQTVLLVLRQQNFSQNFTRKFPKNFVTKVYNFLPKVSLESFVKKYHPGHVKFCRNFAKTLNAIRIT